MINRKDTNMLTEDQKAQYVKTGGVKCPYCGSDDISYRVEDDMPPYSDISCDACDRKWRELYDVIALIEFCHDCGEEVHDGVCRVCYASQR